MRDELEILARDQLDEYDVEACLEHYDNLVAEGSSETDAFTDCCVEFDLEVETE